MYPVHFSSAVAFLLVSALLLVAPAQAQESKGTPAARAEVARGKAAFEATDYAAAEAAFRKAVELDPAWPEAHTSYKTAILYVAGARVAEAGTIAREAEAKSIEMLRAQYETWIAAHPKTAGYLWALGDALVTTDRARAEDVCGQAVSLDPAFAPTYKTLARAANARGDVKTQLEFLRKAADASPDTPSYLQSYISALWQVDPAAARKLSLQVADRFPSDPVAAQVLFWLAAQSDDLPEKITQLERVRRQPGNALQSAMLLLYEAYVASDLEKAGALAQEMIARSPAGPLAREWTSSLERQKQVMRVRSLIREERFSDALAVVDAARESPTGKMIVSQNVSDAITLEMTALASEAEAGLGRNDRAYARVMDLFVRQPGDRLHALLVRYGSAGGKTPAAVDADVRARLVEKATPAPDFPILTYPDGRKGSLSDLRGKVVLLNFWFPT